MYGVMEVIIAILLIWLAYEDWKTKRVPVSVLGTLLVVAVVSIFFRKNVTIWELASGVFIGTTFLLVSKWTREAIGYGDSWSILALGIHLGGRDIVGIVLVSSFLASIYALICCLGFKGRKLQGIPYIPFIAVAYIGSVYL